MEAGISWVGCRSWKRWILCQTSTRLSCVNSGVAVTTLLQNSSLVSVLVLAFARAGAIPVVPKNIIARTQGVACIGDELHEGKADRLR
ncbi:MAG: Na+/phosphate symporter [Gammaproteobacteria bacterium]|jgi:Na+/phosphate symporter